MKTKDWIIPATELQADPAAVLQKAQQRPLLVTDEGRPNVYILSVDAFDELMERLAQLEEAELATNLATGVRHFENGEYLSLQKATVLLETKWRQGSAS